MIALVAISVTGLLLTLSSSALLDGEGYEFLAIIHMATVVLTLVFIPFGKFFHVIQRPASVGVEVYKRTSAAERRDLRLPPVRGAARDRRLRPRSRGHDG